MVLSSSDSLVMANHWNSFFTNVGQEISSAVPPVAKKPEDFVKLWQAYSASATGKKLLLANISAISASGFFMNQFPPIPTSFPCAVDTGGK